MIFEDGRRALRLLHMRQGRRQLDVALFFALFFGLLNAALDVANRLGIFVHFDLVARPELSLQARQLLRHRVENALVLPQSGFARGALRAAAIANSFSNTARGFHSIGSGCVGLRQESVCV